MEGGVIVRLRLMSGEKMESEGWVNCEVGSGDKMRKEDGGVTARLEVVIKWNEW